MIMKRLIKSILMNYLSLVNKKRIHKKGFQFLFLNYFQDFRPLILFILLQKHESKFL